MADVRLADVCGLLAGARNMAQLEGVRVVHGTSNAAWTESTVVEPNEGESCCFCGTTAAQTRWYDRGANQYIAKCPLRARAKASDRVCRTCYIDKSRQNRVGQRGNPLDKLLTRFGRRHLTPRA